MSRNDKSGEKKIGSWLPAAGGGLGVKGESTDRPGVFPSGDENVLK